MAEIFPESPLTSLPDAVAAMGALPVPVGPVSQALSEEREREIRSLDLLALMDDRVAPVISAHLAVLLAEIDGLRAQRDRRRARLVAMDADALNMRGALSPNGEDRKVPFPLGPTLLPAVEWLISRVAELEAERHSTNEALDDAVRELRASAQHALPWAHTMPDDDLSGFLNDLVSAAMGRWQSDPEVPDREVLAAVEKACAAWRTPGEGFRSDPEPDECTCPPSDQPGPHQLGCPLAEVPVSALREVADGEHYAHVHHPYRAGRDLPELGGA